mmetsp:Transcript_8394/g.15464  ORF Transcript_8394/g.15464 Transcript_8394/m.15464 type:complete len:110 (+) Transcript_8394:104-433(+)
MDSPTKTISNKILLGQTRFSNTDSFLFFPNQSSVFLPSTSSRTRKYIHPCPFIHVHSFIQSIYSFTLHSIVSRIHVSLLYSSFLASGSFSPAAAAGLGVADDPSNMGKM